MSQLNLDSVKKRLSILGEFKEFAMRGNVVDLAVGVIIGAAFGKIVTSLVSDILMPPIGKLMGDVNFKDLVYRLYDTHGAPAAKTLEEAQKGGAVIAYGNFINSIIDFVIVAFCIFLVVKLMNKLLPAPPPPGPPPQEKLLTEIRDILKNKA